MIRRETPETFLATAPVNPAFHTFVFQDHPALVPLDEDSDSLVILSNGLNVAGAYRRCRSKMLGWLQFVEKLPSCPMEDAAEVALQMSAWMFEYRDAAVLLASVRPGNEKGRAFTEAIGGKLVFQADGEDLYQTVRSLQ